MMNGSTKFLNKDTRYKSQTKEKIWEVDDQMSSRLSVITLCQALTLLHSIYRKVKTDN